MSYVQAAGVMFSRHSALLLGLRLNLQELEEHLRSGCVFVWPRSLCSDLHLSQQCSRGPLLFQMIVAQQVA